MTPQRYLLNLAKLADVNFNVAVLWDETVQTLSRRAGLARRKGKRWGCVLCAVLNAVARRFFNQPDHCEAAVEAGEVV